MRVLLVMLSFIFISHVQGKMNLEALRKFLEPLKDSCMEETGASERQVSSIQRGEFPPERELKCYYSCMFHKMKAVRESKFSLDLLRAQNKALVEEKLATSLIALVDSCGYLTANEDVCQAAFDYVKCSYETDSSVAIFP